jgi:hypothetical protein
VLRICAKLRPVNFPVTTIQAPEIAALTASVTIYGPLIASEVYEHKEGRGRTSLYVASLCGACLCIAALISGTPFLRDAALIVLALVVLSILLPVLVDRLRGKQWHWPKVAIRLWERPKLVLVGLGLALAVTAGAALGAMVLGRSTTTTISVSPSGRYRIAGTCVNGSCYVNECEKPATCGSENKGTLEEDTAVDIVCQAKGERAKAPNDKHSIVWDRLSTHFYVSDLFVAGTRSGHFAPELPRCSTS